MLLTQFRPIASNIKTINLFGKTYNVNQKEVSI